MCFEGENFQTTYNNFEARQEVGLESDLKR